MDRVLSGFVNEFMNEYSIRIFYQKSLINHEFLKNLRF